MIQKDETEVKSVEASTGGAKGTKLARFDLIPPQPLWELAEHYGRGCKKYAARNWERGYAWSKSYASVMRHLTQWWSGEEYDLCRPDCPPDCKEHTGSHHLTSAAWHCFALREFTLKYPELDDRSVRFHENLEEEKQEEDVAPLDVKLDWTYVTPHDIPSIFGPRYVVTEDGSLVKENANGK